MDRWVDGWMDGWMGRWIDGRMDGHTGYTEYMLAGSGCSILIPLTSSQHNLYDIYPLCVQCWTPDYGQRNCPKHVEFYSKNKSEKLVHLIGFII
jgi:hypothetical protein